MRSISPTISYHDSNRLRSRGMPRCEDGCSRSWLSAGALAVSKSQARSGKSQTTPFVFILLLKASERTPILLQHGNLLIPELNAASLSKFAYDKLRQAGVDVRLNSGAKGVTAAGVRLNSGELIEAATVVSTVGTSPNPLIQRLGLPLQRGRLVTNPDMSVPGVSNVWALGDCAVVPNAADQSPSPTTAQFAMRQGKQLAANLARTFKAQPTQPFS